MKIVINGCFGGFGLSDKAYERMIELGIPLVEYINEEQGKVIHTNYDSPIIKLSGTKYWDSWTRDCESRSDSILVQVVEELGDEASNRFAELKIVDIPDDVCYGITEYDGIETVEEEHRSWG